MLPRNYFLLIIEICRSCLICLPNLLLFLSWWSYTCPPRMHGMFRLCILVSPNFQHSVCIFISPLFRTWVLFTISTVPRHMSLPTRESADGFDGAFRGVFYKHTSFDYTPQTMKRTRFQRCYRRLQLSPFWPRIHVAFRYVYTRNLHSREMHIPLSDFSR